MADVLSREQVRTSADAIEAGAVKALHGDVGALQSMQRQLQGLGSNEAAVQVGKQMAWDSVIPGLGEVQVNMAHGKATSIDFMASPSNTVRCEAAKDWACTAQPMAAAHGKRVRS